MITKVFVDMREGRCYFNYTVEGGRKGDKRIMGWISQRAHRTGTPLHSNKGTKAKGPLRLVTEVLSRSEGMFDYNFVEMECGHRGPSYANFAEAGVTRARCAQCGKEKA